MMADAVDSVQFNNPGRNDMKMLILSLISVIMMILTLMPISGASGQQPEDPEYAWVLVEINDYENAEKWTANDAHDSYIVTHSYSRGIYSASSTYEGPDYYGTGVGGTLAVRAEFSGMPDIIYPDKPVTLKLTFVPTEDSVVKLSFYAYTSANFDQWDIKPGGVTGNAIAFTNADGQDSFKIVGTSSVSYDETLTATLGPGYDDSRIALRLGFYMGVSMGTNYVYEWKQVGESTPQTTQVKPVPSATPKPRLTPVWNLPTPTMLPSICKIADLYGQVNVRPNDEDDDAYIFAWNGMQLYHNNRVKTLRRSGCIISFSDLSTYIMKEDTTIVLDIANEKETKITLLAGNVWINFKSMIRDGSMQTEVEGQWTVGGVKGTTVIFEENEGVSVAKVIEGTVEFTSKVTGEVVEVNGGQMVSGDATGLGELTSFDIDAELETWDEKTQQLTAKALAENKDGVNAGFIILIVAVAGALVAAILVIMSVINLLKRRKPVPSISPAYPRSQLSQNPPAPNKKVNNSSARYCKNCGNPISPDSKFCTKCGQRLE